MRCTQLKNHAGTTAIIVALAALAPVSVAAQEAGVPTNASAPQEITMPEIVVTARKREERLRDIPESISALTSADLVSRGVATIADLGRQTPGLQLNTRQDNTPNVAIRGIGSFGNVQGVGFFIDDVQNFTDQTMRLGDLERVEILKGPQGTLYGGSAIGGAIKYITVKPTFDAYAKGSVEFGENQFRSIFGAVNAPIGGDVVAVRLSGYYTHDNGFVKDSNLNIWTSEFKEHGVRGQMLVTQDRFDALFTLRYRKYDGPGFTYIRQSNINNPLFDSRLTFRPQAKKETLAGTSSLNYDLDNVMLTSITSYTTQDYDYRVDGDYVPANIAVGIISNPRKAKVLTQELRLTSQNSSNLEWLFGLYGQQLKNVASIPSPGVLIQQGVTFNPESDRTLKQEDLAAFGTANLKLGQLTIGGGLRLLHTSYKAHVLVAKHVAVNTFYTVKDTAILPKLSLSYKTDGGTMLYFNAAEGYESGKVSTDTSPTKPYKAEKAWTFEAGAKGQALDRMVDFEGAVFYIAYKNKQAEDRYFDTNGLLVEAVSNLGKSSTIGAEANITVRPAKGFSVYANGNYMRAKWGDNIIFRKGALNAQNIGGQDIPNSPRWTANFGSDLRQPIGSGLMISLHADASYTGKFRWRLQNVAQNYNPAYWVANARLAIGAENGSWELAGRVENLFNEKYFTEFSPGAAFIGSDAAVLAATNAFNANGCTTPARCSNGAVAPMRRFVGSLAFRF